MPKLKKAWSKSPELGSKMVRALQAIPKGVERYRLRRWIKQRRGINVFVMNPQLHAALKSRGMVMVCRQCEESILVGDEVVSKPRRREGRTRTKYYHFDCYRRLFL